MKVTAPEEVEMTTIDRIVLTPRAVAAWGRVAREAAEDLRSVAEIPDEDAEVLPSGELRIHVTHPARGVLAQLILPAEDWDWSN